MARFVFYRCPDCGGTFRHLHHPSDDPPPDRCALCHSWMSDQEPPEEVFVPQAPLIRENTYAKSVDQVYRQTEADSIGRAEEAGDMLEAAYRAQHIDDEHSGLVRVEQKNEIAKLKSELKITNMRDPSEMREGDTAGIMPASDAAKRLTNGPAVPGFQQLQGGVPNYAPGAGSTRAGSSTHAAINGHQGWVDGTPASPNPVHSQRAAAMIARGNLGSYKP